MTNTFKDYQNTYANIYLKFFFNFGKPSDDYFILTGSFIVNLNNISIKHHTILSQHSSSCDLNGLLVQACYKLFNIFKYCFFDLLKMSNVHL